MNCIVVSYHPIFNDNAKNLAVILDCPCWFMSPDLSLCKECYVYGAQNAPVIVLNAHSKGVKVTVMQSEQSTSSFWSESGNYLKLLRQPNIRIIDWSPINSIRLAECKCQPMYSRFTYLFSRPKNIPLLKERPIDLFFCGVGTPSRQITMKILKEIRQDLNIRAVFDYSLRDPILMMKALLQCKIVINIPCYKASALECHRINQAITCGCKVISTRSACKELNKEYESYVTFTNNIVNHVRDLQIDESDNYDIYQLWIKEYARPMVNKFIEEVKSI